MTNYKREEIGPSGLVTRPLSQSYYQQTTQIQQHHQNSDYLFKSNSLSNFSHKIDDKHEAIKKALPPLPSSNSLHQTFRPLIKDRQSLKTFDEQPPLSRRPSKKYVASSDYSSAATSRRPSITGALTNGISSPPYEVRNRTARPFSASYDFTSTANFNGGLRSVRASPRASPIRDISNITMSPSLSRRGSIVEARKLPRPEPSPMRELPPAPPKPKVKHYPLPPPSYTEGMLAVSRRLRNRSSSPCPNYSEMELSKRPGLIPAAIGRPSPSREMIRMSVGGPPMKYQYGRYI